MKLFKIVALIVLIIFAGIGVLFSSVFVAMQFGLLNVRGSIDARNNSIFSINTPQSHSSSTNTSGDSVTDTTLPDISCISEQPTCDWSETREWDVVSGGLTKDESIIDKVATQTGIPSRLIAAVVIPEQIRFFTSNREVFKRYFEPLKILGSLSKFSLGVSGIKQDTAEAIEHNAIATSSAFYPGDEYAALLAYSDNTNQSDELYNRLTDEKNHYYSYLYTAVFIKEILTQWEKAGYDITNQPDIVATLFNIGFAGSNPNPAPKVAGTVITVGGTNYTFGEMSGLFYKSDQLPEFKK